MYYDIRLINNLAQRLAFLADNYVPILATAVMNGTSGPAEVTGAVIGAMPHLIEKAVVTNTTLPGDVLLQVASQFVREFEALIKMLSSAGGSSNPLKKVMFNTLFHTMFSREYNDLKPRFSGIWEKGRTEQADPVDYVACGVLKLCENSSGLDLDREPNVRAICGAVQDLFSAVHEQIQQS